MASLMETRAIDCPASWKSAELKPRTDWIHQLGAEEIDEIDSALQMAKAEDMTLADLRKEDFPLQRFRALAARVLGALEEGPGLFMIRGFPVDRYSTDELRMIYWGLGKYLGTAVSQSAEGDVIGDVRDLRIPPDSPRYRGYQTNNGGVFHCDTCDVAVLFVLRPAMRGGVSMVASSVAIHNEIARTRPDLLEVLYQPFVWSMLEQQREGEPAYYEQPIFSMQDGYISCRYIRPHIAQAQRNFPEVPRLSPKQVEALDLMDELVKRKDFMLPTNFQPGDIQFCNNHVVLHARTAFEDWPEPERHRHLLRLWLSVPNSRPLSPLMGHIYQVQRPGAVRGGFPPRTPGKIVFETTGAETLVT
jgi:hypothetical protein